MSYLLKGCYRVPETIDFRNPQPITEINCKTFLVEFPDHIPIEEAKQYVRERAEKMYELEKERKLV